MDATAFAKFLAYETAKWAKVVKFANITRADLSCSRR